MQVGVIEGRFTFIVHPKEKIIVSINMLFEEGSGWELNSCRLHWGIFVSDSISHRLGYLIGIMCTGEIMCSHSGNCYN